MTVSEDIPGRDAEEANVLPIDQEWEYGVDAIYHNMDMRSDLRTLRSHGMAHIDDWLTRLGVQIEKGCYDKLISVAASKHSFVVVMETLLSKEELRRRWFWGRPEEVPVSAGDDIVKAENESDSIDGYEIDVIYHNMDVRSNFRTFRTGGTSECRPIRFWLKRLAVQIEKGCYDKLISVTATQQTFVVVFSTTLSKDELRERWFWGEPD